MIAFNGVRTSWDVFARNWDLWWLASSSWCDFSSTSANSRAFPSARRQMRISDG